jgi:hypothetical protein
MEDIQVCLRGGCNGEPIWKERRIRIDLRLVQHKTVWLLEKF